MGEHEGPKTRAVIYARVAPSYRGSNTLESQMANCRAYCHERGYVVVAEAQEVLVGYEEPHLPSHDAEVLVVQDVGRLSAHWTIVAHVAYAVRARGLRIKTVANREVWELPVEWAATYHRLLESEARP